MSNSELMLVAFAGGSSSGKTTIAKEIQDQYAGDITVYPQEYHLKRRGSPAALALVNELGSMAFEHPRIIDYELYAANLNALRSGKPVDLNDPPPKLIKEGFVPKRILPSGVIVVEGVYTYLDPRTVDAFDLRLFFELSNEAIRERRLARAPEGSTDFLDSPEHIETVMLPGVEYCLPQRASAHHIIDASRSPEEVTVEVAYWIEEARSHQDTSR